MRWREARGRARAPSGAEGTVHATEHGGELVRYGTALGAVGGLVVGLFAPPLLVSGVVGAVVGAGAGDILRRHEEKQIGVDAQEWLPEGASAVVAVVDDVYLDRLDEQFELASSTLTSAIDQADYDAVVLAVNRGDDQLVEAIVVA